MPTCIYCSKSCRPPLLPDGEPDPEPACPTHRRWLARGWVPYSAPPRIGRPPQPKPPCACGKPSRWSGLCGTCYQRKYRTGDSTPPPPKPERPSACSCGSALIYAKGLCHPCYHRQRRQSGSSDPSAPRCACASGRPIYAKGLCNACYQRARIHGTATPPPPRDTTPSGSPCSYCSAHPASSKGLCSSCYQRQHRNGFLERRRAPGGGRKVFCEKVGQPAQPVVNSVPS